MKVPGHNHAPQRERRRRAQGAPGARCATASRVRARWQQPRARLSPLCLDHSRLGGEITSSRHSLRLSRHKNTSSSQTNYNFSSSPFLIRSRCSLSRGWGVTPIGGPYPSVLSLPLARATTLGRTHSGSASPRNCPICGRLEEETQSDLPRRHGSDVGSGHLRSLQGRGLLPRSSLFAAAFIAANIETVVLKIFFAKPTARSRPSQM